MLLALVLRTDHNVGKLVFYAQNFALIAVTFYCYVVILLGILIAEFDADMASFQ